MLDIGWNELLIIALVTILVVGPKELPRVLRTVTQFFRKLRAMASEFQSSLDDLAREAELEDIKQNIEKTASSDIAGDLEREFDPTGDIDRSVRELEKEVKEDPRKANKPARAESAQARSAEPAASGKSSSASSGGKTKSSRTASTRSASKTGAKSKPASKTKKKAGKAS